MSQHGLKTHRLWWIHINSTLRTIPLHVTGTYFDRFSHDFQMISDPKSFQNDPKNRIPDATWLTGSLGLGTAQRQAASAAERIEGGAMCPRRKFTTFPCWTSWKAAFLFIFSLDHPRSWVLSLSYTVISYYIDCEILVLETSFLRPEMKFLYVFKLNKDQTFNIHKLGEVLQRNRCGTPWVARPPWISMDFHCFFVLSIMSFCVNAENLCFDVEDDNIYNII